MFIFVLRNYQVNQNKICDGLIDEIVLCDGSPGASLMVMSFKGSEAMVERRMDPLLRKARWDSKIKIVRIDTQGLSEWQ